MHIVDINNENIAYLVIPETIGKFSGLRDNVGREMYELDKYRHPKTGLPGVVIFEDGCFFMRWTDGKKEYLYLACNYAEYVGDQQVRLDKDILDKADAMAFELAARANAFWDEGDIADVQAFGYCDSAEEAQANNSRAKGIRNILAKSCNSELTAEEMLVIKAAAHEREILDNTMALDRSRREVLEDFYANTVLNRWQAETAADWWHCNDNYSRYIHGKDIAAPVGSEIGQTTLCKKLSIWFKHDSTVIDFATIDGEKVDYSES